MEKLRVHGQVGKARALGSLMQVALDLTEKILPPVPSCIPCYPFPDNHIHARPSLCLNGKSADTGCSVVVSDLAGARCKCDTCDG